VAALSDTIAADTINVRITPEPLHARACFLKEKVFLNYEWEGIKDELRECRCEKVKCGNNVPHFTSTVELTQLIVNLRSTSGR